MTDASVPQDLEARLAAMAGAWADAPEDAGSIYTPPPDGTYQALLHEWRFVEQRDPPHAAFLVVVFQLVHNEGPVNGKLVETMFSLEDPERIRHLKTFFSRLEVLERMEITDVRPGSALLNELLDTPCLIAVKTAAQDGQTLYDSMGRRKINVYLNQRLGGLDTSDFAARGSDIPPPAQGDFGLQPAAATSYGNPPDDDIPF